MTTCAILERDSRARSVLLAVAVVLLLVPAMVTLGQGAGQMFAGAGMGWSFFTVLGNSLGIAVGAALIGLILGLPAGLLLGLYRVPLRQGVTIALALPLVLPGFMPAIGLHRLALGIHVELARALEGRTGCMIVTSGVAIGLVSLAVLNACRALPGSALDAARLAGGESTVLTASARRVFGSAVTAALLAAAIGLADDGAAQVLGVASAAGDIQLAFAQERSFAVAGARCVVMAVAALLLALPIVTVVVREPGAALLPRATRSLARCEAPKVGRTMLSLCLIVAWVLMPLVGIALPAMQGIELGKAADLLARTWENTLVYALGSALLATASALTLVLLGGRSRRLQGGLLALALVMLALPPQSQALGLLELGSSAPTFLDPLLRSRFTVCMALALRTLPVAIVLLFARWRSMPASLPFAGAVHGVGLGAFARFVLLPFFAPALLMTLAICALLADAQTDIVQLLHPPGEPSLGVAVLTVLANTREAFGASLCLMRIVLGAVVLLLVSRLGGLAR